MTQDIAIKLQRVTKIYNVHHEKPTLVENIFHPSSIQRFTALNDVSFIITKGEKIGIIGHNGAGKTTLLKIICGITCPTSGNVEINGKVVSLIDISAGFHPDLSGAKNIYLNGLVIGMSKQEIATVYQKIISFSGIRRFIDAPLYTYSEGMKLRLGFSIAVHSNPDILILDEAINAGDQAFQLKIKKTLAKIFAQQKTILVASHWADFLVENTHKCLLMRKGRVLDFGNTQHIISTYKLNQLD